MRPTHHCRFFGLLAISLMVGSLLVPAALADRDGRRGEDRGSDDRGGRGNRNGDRGSDRGSDRGGDDGRGRSGYGEATLSIRTAVDMVLSRYGGQVVKAETQSRDGQMFYLIRVLTPEGTLVRVRVDALTGRMD
jgi:uncharacterized membrane protein YkoI